MSDIEFIANQIAIIDQDEIIKKRHPDEPILEMNDKVFEGTLESKALKYYEEH